ncbi:MAG: FKBP-type peptidyl-prolyl cis-trans isomerase, partial [Gammaproteobacteria bacterium]
MKALPSGLQYEVLQKGAGASPKLDDIVFANYRGTLPDGTEFDASEAEPVSFPLARVIRGWQEGLALMNKGAKYRLYVPS